MGGRLCDLEEISKLAKSITVFSRSACHAEHIIIKKG